MTSFAFILNDFKYSGNIPYELIDGYYLDKASIKQRKFIKNTLNQQWDNLYKYHFYEAKREKVEGKDETRSSQIPQKDWRYWVINFDVKDHEVETLKYVFNLIWERPITIGFISQNGGFNYRPPILFNYYKNWNNKIQVTKEIEERTFSLVPDYFSRLKELEIKREKMHQAHFDYEMLKSLPYGSKFKTLGYFTLIEMLITHKPDPSDSGDSLRKQLRNKMKLLNNRFQIKLIGNEYFQGEPNFTTIWNKLYDLRSEIAHGNNFDFSSYYQVLNSRKNVDAYLSCATRSLLQHSLFEPQLLADLKDC